MRMGPSTATLTGTPLAMRMNYERVIAAVLQTSRALESAKF